MNGSRALLHRTRPLRLAKAAAFTHTFDSSYSRGFYDCAVQNFPAWFDVCHCHIVFNAFDRC
jgi:hypothetical protein